MKILKSIIALAIALGLGLMLQSPGFTSVSTGAITVEATIPQLTQALNVTITPVNSSDDSWPPAGTPGVGSMSGFGGLTPNFTYNVFNAAKYYAVDVGVVDNSGSSWYVTHTKSSIKKGTTTENLDYNVNVSFVKITKSTTGVETQTPLFKKVFAESAVTSTTALSKAVLSGGWLRIYYGIATGDTRVGKEDAANALPILFDKPYGTYSGSVTLTLSP